jgi:hypothetical protein
LRTAAHLTSFPCAWRRRDNAGIFKAIELDATSRRRTGREYELAGGTRQEAIATLLGLLQVTPDQVEVDPGRTIVIVGASLWTLVAIRPPDAATNPSQRRAGAKHKRVR